MLVPTRCPVCQAIGPAPCGPCAATLRRAPALPPPPGLDACAALLAYEDGGRELVARLKYRNARAVLGWLVWQLAMLVDGIAVAGGIDVVTWAPTSGARRRTRGFDQARLLATGVARRHRLSCAHLLERSTGPPQTGLGLAARREGPRFVVRPGAVVPPVVLVVDDVVTSGATMTAAARCLRDAGAETVVGLAAGRTPLKAPRRRADA